jgi:hypothetical protein
MYKLYLIQLLQKFGQLFEDLIFSIIKKDLEGFI